MSNADIIWRLVEMLLEANKQNEKTNEQNKED